MSETWAATRKSIRRLKETWAEADESTRWDVGFWITGALTMAVAIVQQFGIIGATFCLGWFIYSVGAGNLKR